MARVEYPAIETLTDENAKALAKLPKLNIFKMLAGCETMFKPFMAFAGAVLGQTKIDPILREIAIVRVGLHSGASYEVHQHDAISRQLGMNDDMIAGLRIDADQSCFTDQQRAILRFTDEVVLNVKASDESFAEVSAFLTISEVQELLMAIGCYGLVSRYLENMEIEIEDQSDNIALDLKVLKRD